VSSEKTLLASRFRGGMLEGEEKSRVQGRAEGFVEGERKSKVQVAKEMLAKNLTITLISEVTGLTATEIQTLHSIGNSIRVLETSFLNCHEQRHNSSRVSLMNAYVLAPCVVLGIDNDGGDDILSV